MNRAASDRIDWSQFWNPGPVRQFTDDELRRAGRDAPSRTVVVSVLFNLAFTAALVLGLAPAAVVPALTGVFAGGYVALLALARALWRRPERRLLLRINIGLFFVGIGFGLLAGLLPHWKETFHGRWIFGATWGLSIAASLGLWFLAMFRSEQIAGRLRELTERDRAVEMARQLAAAQIQPHFLFNSLASLQHWVQAKDDRAAQMLEALTGFLRATLPLFNQARLRLGDEAEAARRYLQVMQLRLGARLTFAVDIEPTVADRQVPPGLLLTLVENAVEHGVQGSLSGGEVLVRAFRDGARTVIRVRDTGPGLAPGAADGVGLSNSRARLKQAWGEAASLRLADAAGGGCEARIELPGDASPTIP